MRFLNSQRVLSNVRIATAHLRGSPAPAEELKQSFIAALNRAQSMNLRAITNNFYLEFENPELVRTLVDRTVFSVEETSNNAHLFSVSERQSVETLVEAAKRLLQMKGPELYNLMTQVIGTIAAYRIPQRDGGSVSCCIGLIWLSPGPEWTIEYCAEMLVHEFIHNSVFLEDMVRGIMPTPALLEHEDALAISAIRQTRRPYDKAFHSACVAAGLMYFYHLIGKDVEANRYLIPLRQTIFDLTDRYNLLSSKGSQLLTENGRQLLAELSQFIANGVDFSVITDGLSMRDKAAEALAAD